MVSGSGSGERVHAARRGSEGGQMLTPQPHAPIQWGWMYGENNGSKPTDRLNRVPPFSFFPCRRAPSRYLYLSFLLFTHSFGPALSARLSPVAPAPSFCLRREIRNRYIIVNDLHPAILPANIYAAFDGHKVMVTDVKSCEDLSHINRLLLYQFVYIKSL